jgi:hypothetical protein
MLGPAVSAESIAAALGGYKASSGWMAHCPAHDDRTPSLSLRDGETGALMFYCHAGCTQQQVIAALQARGIWLDLRPRFPTAAKRDAGPGKAPPSLYIWHAAGPAAETLAETYLRSRGISLSLPPALRFHPRLKHPSGGTWPAMVALVTRDDKPVAVHRTFLSRDGKAKAPVEPQKMMLGPCRGGAVRLAEVGTPLMVGEGIETCLSVMQATGCPAWAALSTSGLRALDLPEGVIEVIILADGDAPGERAARHAAARWVRQGQRVRIARPPPNHDFNDVLRK